MPYLWVKNMSKKILMPDLLKMFNDCDTFSLTGEPYISITNEDKNNALNEIRDKTKKILLNNYNLLTNSYTLPSFETLYDEITRECINFSKTQKEIYMKKRGFFYNRFIADKVGTDTKYSEPLGYFWNFYQMIGSNLDREEYIDELIKKNKKIRAMDNIKNKILRDNLVRYEILFHNHCTVSSSLMVNYYFKLNDETKKWLSQFKNDFEIKGNLEDLAFYKNGKIQFSSCTHEEFNSIK